MPARKNAGLTLGAKLNVVDHADRNTHTYHDREALEAPSLEDVKRWRALRADSIYLAA